MRETRICPGCNEEDLISISAAKPEVLFQLVKLYESLGEKTGFDQREEARLDQGEVCESCGFVIIKDRYGNYSTYKIEV